MNNLAKTPTPVVRIDWTATLRSMPVGTSMRIGRKEVTVSSLRVKASNLKKGGYVFTVQSVDSDDYAIVTREK